MTHPVDIIVFVSTTVSLKDEYINKLTSSSTVRDIIGVIDVSGGDQAKDRQESSYDTRSHDKKEKNTKLRPVLPLTRLSTLK